jgi:Tc5 transposase DNA-binding domain
MPNLHRIPEAIADLDTQEVPNIRSTAIKYGLCPKTLENRWKGKSISMQEAVSIHRQALTNAQEKALIGIINKLTDRRMPPTSAIVKNLAEEIRGAPVGKNWTAQFVERHKDKLKSVYLKNMETKRVKSEYPPSYEYFFKLVLSYFMLLLKLLCLEPR